MEIAVFVAQVLFAVQQIEMRLILGRVRMGPRDDVLEVVVLELHNLVLNLLRFELVELVVVVRIVMVNIVRELLHLQDFVDRLVVLLLEDEVVVDEALEIGDLMDLRIVPLKVQLSRKSWLIV